MLSEIVSKSTFVVCNMNQHPILSLFTKFELNWLRNKKVMKSLIFDGTSGKIREPKLEMTS